MIPISNHQKDSYILKDHTPQPSTPIKHAGSEYPGDLKNISKPIEVPTRIE